MGWKIPLLLWEFDKFCLIKLVTHTNQPVTLENWNALCRDPERLEDYFWHLELSWKRFKIVYHFWSRLIPDTLREPEVVWKWCSDHHLWTVLLPTRLHLYVQSPNQPHIPSLLFCLTGPLCDGCEHSTPGNLSAENLVWKWGGGGGGDGKEAANLSDKESKYNCEEKT